MLSMRRCIPYCGSALVAQRVQAARERTSFAVSMSARSFAGRAGASSPSHFNRRVSAEVSGPWRVKWAINQSASAPVICSLSARAASS
jgi:hypothetical protein